MRGIAFLSLLALCACQATSPEEIEARTARVEEYIAASPDVTPRRAELLRAGEFRYGLTTLEDMRALEPRLKKQYAMTDDEGPYEVWGFAVRHGSMWQKDEIRQYWFREGVLARKPEKAYEEE